ncbi:hypothetical protein ABBQ32_004356 [Trebouxia sp. C0010 RCD-2024]
MCLFDREDTFLKEHAAVVAVAASQAVQVEVDRFSLATSLLSVAARAHCGLPCAITPLSPPEVLGAAPPDSVKAKFEKQTAMSFPDWVAALDKLLPKLASAIRFALAAAASEGDKYQPASSQKAKGGAKGAAPAKKADPKGEGQNERAVQAALQEAAKGVDRECALLHTRLRLLASHALVPKVWCLAAAAVPCTGNVAGDGEMMGLCF